MIRKDFQDADPVVLSRILSMVKWAVVFMAATPGEARLHYRQTLHWFCKLSWIS